MKLIFNNRETNLFYTQDADGILGLAPNNDRYNSIVFKLGLNI